MSENKDQELGYTMNRLLNKEYYLNKHLKKRLQEQINNLSDEYGIKTEFIDVALLLLVVHFDLMGRLVAGEISDKNTTTNAIAFMRKYLGQVDPRYKEISGILYHMLRHGYVHLFSPKRVTLKNNNIFDLSFCLGPDRQTHLDFTKRLETEWMEGKVVVYRMNVHVSQLYEDFISAFDTFGEEVFHDQKTSDKFEKSFKLHRVEGTKEGLNKDKSSLKQDFEFIYSHIQKLL
jgi:hypothetical protein